LPLILRADNNEPTSTSMAFGTSTTASWNITTTSEERTSEQTSEGRVPVPNLVGSSEEDAKAQLQASQLGYRITEVPTVDPTEFEYVVAQDTSAGAMVAKGSTIGVDVGRYGVEIPDVVGEWEADATVDLSLMELGCSVEHSVVDDYYQPGGYPEIGRVLNQDPGPGTLAFPMAEVHLTVGTAGMGAAFFEVSDTTGDVGPFPLEDAQYVAFCDLWPDQADAYDRGSVVVGLYRDGSSPLEFLFAGHSFVCLDSETVLEIGFGFDGSHGDWRLRIVNNNCVHWRVFLLKAQVTTP
jgi:hypothetical protein